MTAALRSALPMAVTARATPSRQVLSVPMLTPWKNLVRDSVSRLWLAVAISPTVRSCASLLASREAVTATVRARVTTSWAWVCSTSRWVAVRACWLRCPADTVAMS